MPAWVRARAGLARAQRGWMVRVRVRVRVAVRRGRSGCGPATLCRVRRAGWRLPLRPPLAAVLAQLVNHPPSEKASVEVFEYVSLRRTISTRIEFLEGVSRSLRICEPA